MEKKIYTSEEHRIPINKVDSHALYVMEKLRIAGFVAYLVGGSVRDLLLGKKPKDFDISTSASPEQIKGIFRNCILIGRRFRLAHIRFGRKILEVSTFRSGDIEAHELIVRDNQWGYPEEDALRRDFTINGLFYDPATQTIIDYVGGFADLQKKYLRTIGKPYIRFKQDPVRMLRLLKFQARFGFEVDQEAHIALLECRGEITKSSPARILEEILRMLESGSAKLFIQLLSDHGILYHLVPVLARFLEKEKESEDIYIFLEEIDLIHKDPINPLFERPIIFSCLVYPILEKRIHETYLERDHTPHLGQIQMEVRELLRELFHSFLLIPKKLRTSMNSILTSQYRLTPVGKNIKRKKRISRDPDFSLALKFLNLRACIEPGLQKIYEEWDQKYVEMIKHKKQREKQKR
ncbi:MAG: polynucleotide adenylyltransferase PcnB [Chlamydiae bacterium]|nr:polynucleotide adenylyltransferase PcnB [Chlamydiota bacterium]